MNPLAEKLNEQLETAAPEVLAMLSPYGRRLYYPRGILTQSAEAKEKAHTANATIGIATENGEPMSLPSLLEMVPSFEARDVVNYAPPGGRPALREAWREKLLKENPSLAGKTFGLPVVTSAITHALTVFGELFVGEGDTLLLPDKLWGNYRLAFEVRHGAEIKTFPFYKGGGFDTDGFAEGLRLAGESSEKVVVLLNFPNNPTGYMPTPAEGDSIAAALIAQAELGTKLVVAADDAYFGLFYHLGEPSMTESLFGVLTGRHPNLLAVKLDGATKELFVWGLRVGFITFGPGRPETADAVCQALDAKARGAIRAGISNVPMLSQAMIERTLGAPSIAAERKEKEETLRLRAEKVYKEANAPRYKESWEVYPFNSGYFMCVKLKDVDAEKLRVHLLDKYGVGLIATSATDLRIAFSCLEVEQVEPLFETIHKAAQELV